MIDLTLDPSDTRPSREPVARPARAGRLRMVAFALVGASAVVGFGVAASTLMAGLAAPAPVKRASSSRAADWPDLKDGLPALAGTNTASPPKPGEPAAPALRMASLPDPIAAPAASTSAPRSVAIAALPAAAALAEPATKRLPNATIVTAIGPARQAVTLAPGRTAALQPPLASETVRARTEADPVAKPDPVGRAAVTQAGIAPTTVPEKPKRQAVTVRRPVPAGTAAAPATVASAEAPEQETEVLGIKLPSLAPAGKKLREGVDALGEAVRNVF